MALRFYVFESMSEEQTKKSVDMARNMLMFKGRQQGPNVFHNTFQLDKF